MFVMDGYEFCKVVWEFEKKYLCRIVIVVLIVNVMVSDEWKCLNVGMDVFFIKFID